MWLIKFVWFTYFTSRLWKNDSLPLLRKTKTIPPREENIEYLDWVTRFPLRINIRLRILSRISCIWCKLQPCCNEQISSYMSYVYIYQVLSPLFIRKTYHDSYSSSIETDRTESARPSSNQFIYWLKPSAMKNHVKHDLHLEVRPARHIRIGRSVSTLTP